MNVTGPLDANVRLALARDSLTGLSVGDALGAGCAHPEELTEGELSGSVWEWTDDSEMACSIVAMLATRGAIDRDELAAAFAHRCTVHRGYGSGALRVLGLIRAGTPWSTAASSAFGGEGSCGNGAAMRIAPLGAYFADAPTRAAAEAVAASEVTHAHPEGIAGGVAVAVAASVAARARLAGRRPDPEELLTAVIDALAGPGEVRAGVQRARTLLGQPVDAVARELGNGSAATAQDTVPFTLWVAATFLDDYPQAIRSCVAVGGDTDTTAAIVGGIVAAYTGVDTPGGVPAPWVAAREPLPDWVP
jgi:ADP-ribosylglycohydrolase